MPCCLQRKLLCLLASFLICGFLFAANPKVVKIKIEGNILVSENKILLLLKTRVNSDFDEETWKKDIETLSRSPYFSSISYKTETVPEGIEIILSVIENPQISRIVFSRAKVFKEKEFEKNFAVKTGDFYIESAVKQAAEDLTRQYEDKGFYFGSVSYKAVPSGPGHVNLNVDIDEGTRVAAGKIIFTGNEPFPAKRLKGLMKIKERKWPFLLGSYKPETLDEDVKTIVKFYQDNGFPECKAEKSVELKKNRLVITISITKGMLYHFGKVNFKGDLHFPENALRKKITFKEGEVFSQAKLDESFNGIKTMYFDEGLLNSVLISIPETEKSTMNLTFQISSGEKVTVNEIKITGNTITKDKVIRREMKLNPGDFFSGTKLRKSYNNLHDLDYFDSINIYPKPTEEQPNSADIIVDVKDKEKTGVFMIGGGYSTLDKLIGIMSLEQRNFDIKNPPSFTGGGQDLKVSLQTGQVSRGFDLSFTEPYFRDKPVSVGGDIYGSTYQWDNFTEAHKGADVRVGRRWDNFSISSTLRAENVRLEDITILPFENQAGTKRVDSLSTTLSWQNLDRMVLPQSGDKLDFTVEVAGGPFMGDVDYYKWSLQNDYYYPLKKLVFHSMTLLGEIKEYGSTPDVPLYERFFGGGIGSIEGYKERNLGPVEDGIVIGGKTLFAENIELLYPVKEDVLWTVIFYDFGNVWEKWDFSDMVHSIGVGIRVKVPLFPAPIQVDYGYGLNSIPGQSRGHFHIGMSMGF